MSRRAHDSIDRRHVHLRMRHHPAVPLERQDPPHAGVDPLLRQSPVMDGTEDRPDRGLRGGAHEEDVRAGLERAHGHLGVAVALATAGNGVSANTTGSSGGSSTSTATTGTTP